MMRVKRFPTLMAYMIRKFFQLGARTVTACITALIGAMLIFAAPEVGVAGAIGGVVLGGISAVLMHPQSPR